MYANVFYGRWVMTCMYVYVNVICKYINIYVNGNMFSDIICFRKVRLDLISNWGEK